MSFSVSAQQMSPENAAMFARYPAGAIFHGKPATPDVTDPDAHMFRTRIRAGAAQGVVFAGHYSVAVWGCGASCISFAVIDAITGRVHFFPASISQINEAGERLTYRKNSRAIHVIGSLNEENSADRWFLWDGHEFKLISEKPARLLDDQGNELKP
jgi:hypothetical protein